MKKVLQKILPFILCLCMLFLFACKDTPANPDNDGNTPSGGNEQETPPDDKDPDDDKDPEPVKQTYTVSAKDKQAAAIANVWFEAYYFEDEQNKSGLTVESKASTDANGIATFEFKPEEGATYRARVAASGENDTDPACDYHYEIDFNDTKTSLVFDSERTAAAVFDFYPNKFPGSLTQGHSYKRAYAGKDESKNDTFTESGNDLVLNVKSGIIEYFNFNPYVPPRMSGSEELDTVTNNARLAASGKYALSFTTESDANVTMIYYIASKASTVFDENKIPAYAYAITGEAPDSATDSEIYTGNGTISLELKKSEAGQDSYFGVKADKDCAVTVSVTRTDDVEEEQQVTLQTLRPTGNPVEWTDAKIAENRTEGDSLMEIKYDGSVAVTLGSDGYYHVGTESGPILYAVLTKATRASDIALNKYDQQTDRGIQAYQFPSKDNPYIKFDYIEFINGKLADDGKTKEIKGYADLAANSYGMYPVNEELKTFLEYMSNSFLGIQSLTAPNWLIPCKYFGSNTVAGTGVILATGMRTISLTKSEAYDGKLYTVKSQSGGKFRLTATDDKALIWTTDANNPIIGEKNEDGEFVFSGTYEFELKAGETFSFYCGYSWFEAAEYNLTVFKTPPDSEPYIGVGLNNVTIDEAETERTFFFTPEKSGYYRVVISENDIDGLLSIVKGFEGALFDFNDIYEPDENGNIVGAPIYFEANKEVEIYINAEIAKDYLFTLESAEAPKFIVGENGNEISNISVHSPITMKFGGETGTYTIKIDGMQFSRRSTITITISGIDYTLNGENDYTVTAQINTDAEITVAADSQWDESFYLFFTEVAAQE